MGFRYIGLKARIAEDIMAYIGAPESEHGTLIDAFAGTGIVAEKAADLGWKLKINDMMTNSIVMSEARLLCKEDVPFKSFGGYTSTLEILNNLEPIEGFMWRTYSPAAKKYCGIERKYFSEGNAKKIDATASQIHKWKNDNLLSSREFALLIATLISSTNTVANIAGTYGCFLAKWTAQSMNDFKLVELPLREKPSEFFVSNIDVFDVLSSEEDTVYLDPPYTKRQYASYYHIPETLAIGDEPVVEGVAGLRPWKDKASVFCYKVKALKALTKLILQQKAKRVVLSYSNEGHIQLDDLVEALKPYGEVEIVDLGSIGRYRPNKIAVENNSNVTEYLVDFRRR